MDRPVDHHPRAFRRLWGVYHADGGLLGELTYVVGKLRGTAHCALCDITHGGLRMKPAWRHLHSSLPVALRLVHRNERSPGLQEATEGRTPCVVLEESGRWRLLMDADALEACAGSVESFAQALRATLEDVQKGGRK